jgi:hypothetical protein
MNEEVIFEKEYDECSIIDIEEDIYDAINNCDSGVSTYVVTITAKKEDE